MLQQVVARQSQSGKRFVLAILIALSALASGCATIGDVPEDPGSAALQTPKRVDPDPWEGFNRTMYEFNDSLDEWVLKPVATGYKFVTPGFVRTGITNFFSNLSEPMVVLNDLLQGKFIQAGSDTARFVVNTVAGLLGLFDIATHMNLEKHDEDFGQTLGVWGVGTGPYVVWPFLGPMNLRDTAGWTVDWFSDPATYAEPPAASWGLWGLEVVNLRANFLGTKDIIDEAASGDPYIFVREAYRQRRLDKIYDGNPPVVDDPMMDELLFGNDNGKEQK